ncbi:MAG: hypothetical protein KC505_10020 [Myxococcales bacterium]|nr:hypothetical protein [Myxococcales bacterium]USN49859.1 MAG: hypothetical protein H6731_06150 [Myxococcales bacterium]
MRLIQFFGLLLAMATTLHAHILQRTPTAKAWPYCQESVETYEWSEQTPLGFSGGDLFAVTGQKRDVKFIYGYKTGESMGYVELKQRSPIVRYIHSEPIYTSDNTFDIGIVCPSARVEVDVDFKIYSEDKAFDDNFATTLSSGTLDWCFEGDCPNAGSYADIYFSLDLDKLNGNFHKDIPAPVNQMRWWGRFYEDEMTANISYSNCECDESGCVSFQVNGASIESYNP